MSRTLMLGVVSSTCLSLLATAASAAVIAADDFSVGTTAADYTAGAIILQTPTRTGFTGAWAAKTDLSGTTTNTAMIGAAGRVEVTSAGTVAPVAYRGLSTPLNDVAGNTYYLSFDTQNTSGAGSNSGQRFFGVSLFNGATEKSLIGSGSGSTVFSVSNAGLTSTVQNTTASTLLLKIAYNGSGNADTLTFFINPDFTKPEADAANVSATVGTSSTLDLTSIDRIRVGGGLTTMTQAFAPHYTDNLSIFQSTSTTDTPFAAPVSSPEPALMSVALAAAFVAGQRRRRVGEGHAF